MDRVGDRQTDWGRELPRMGNTLKTLEANMQGGDNRAGGLGKSEGDELGEVGWGRIIDGFVGDS